jgi:hypothetical protein
MSLKREIKLQNRPQSMKRVFADPLVLLGFAGVGRVMAKGSKWI